jgi:RHS repeat-associated protein
MRRLIEPLRNAGALLLLSGLLALPAAAQNYCNNPVPPCDTNDPASGCYKPPDPPPKCEPKECDKCTKSPCYVGSGAYEWSADDLSIKTTGYPIEVKRLYRSTHAIDGESGYGWVSSLSSRLYYAVFLKAAPDTYSREANVRLPSGVLYRFVENADGSYTPPEGRFDTLVRNADGTWDFWLQRTRSRYRFAANGNLLQIADDYGNTQTWTYVNDRLTRVQDTSGSGRYIDITYGADGRISDVTDLTGRNIHYAYNSSGVMTGMTNPAGQTTAYTYVNGKYVPLLNSVTDHWGRNLSTVTYDAQDRVKSYTDKGETFTYTYNYNNNKTQTSKADSSGNTWVYTFSDASVVTGASAPGGGNTPADTYYANGLVQQHTDPAGIKTYYTYDARGNFLTVINDYQGATAVEWRHTYDPNFPDQLTSVKPYTPGTNNTHPHWQGTLYEYYQAGSNAPGALQHIRKLADDGVTSQLVATFTYDTQGRRLTSADAFGNITTTTYDAAGNAVTVERPANNDAGIRPVSTAGYDALGRATTLTDALGRVTTVTYDVLDRVKTITLPKPSPSSTLTFTTTIYYDEYEAATQLLFTRAVDPNGRTSKFGTDQYGHALRRIDQAGNLRRSVYTKGLLTAIIDTNGNTTTYGYDARRRRNLTTFPDGTSQLITFNADDTVASIRDRANQTISFTWDRHKRVITKSYPNGGVLTRVYQGQKLVQTTDTFASPSENHSYVYDTWFRLVTETQATRGTITRTFDTDDRLATLAVSGGSTATYSYYPDRSIKSIVWSPVAGNFSFAHNLAGQLQTITFPNGQTRSLTYDDQARITQVANVHPSAGTLATFAYGHDLDAFTGQPTQLGFRTSVTATVPALGLAGAITQYGYDSRGQLTQAAYPAGVAYNGLTQSWTYDALGNRTSATENGAAASYVYQTISGNPLNTDRLLSDGGNAYTYDAKGNVTARSGSRGNFTFSYDYDNRLRSVNGDLTSGYLYDTYGRRALKTVSGTATTFLYNELQAIAEGGATPAEYLYVPNVLDQALAMYRNGQIYYYAVDALGSVVTMNDTAGTVQASYAWDAFGTARSQTVNVANSVVYTGREAGEAGRHFYRARWYEPAVGRFDREDPWRWKDELRNMYRYAANRPTALLDPLGKGYWPPGHVWNCDPVRYRATGETSPWDDSAGPLTLPPGNGGSQCFPTPPWWDVDHVCTPYGWVKIYIEAEIRDGVASGRFPGWVGPPEDDWVPPHDCPNMFCPNAPPPPSGPGGPPSSPGGPPALPGTGPDMW